MGCAFDPVRRTVWFGAYWGEYLQEFDPFTGLILNTVPMGGLELFGMSVSADRKLWFAGDNYMTGANYTYALGLENGAYAPGVGVAPTEFAIGPYECDTFVVYVGPGTVPGEYDIDLTFSVDNGPGLDYPIVINVSPAIVRGWNLVSVPVAPSPNNVYIQLSDDIVPFSNDPPNSQIYAWDPVHGIFITPDAFERGRGYYLWGWYDNTHFDVTGIPYYGTMTLTLPYYASAAIPGWNLVGNPVNTEVDWDGVVGNMSFAGIYPIYYILTPGGWASYSPGFPAGASRYIEPYQGFFVLVQSGMTGVLPFGTSAIVHPKLAAESAIPADALPEFAFRIAIESGDIVDNWNYIAVRADATDGIDLNTDAIIPPAIPGAGELGALRCEEQNLQSDVKAIMLDGQVKSWTIRISGATVGEDVILSWQRDHIPDLLDGSMGIDRIYSGYDFDLYDPITDEHIDMRAIDFYSFTYSSARELVVTVNANALGAEQPGKLPEKFSLAQNIPNPFNATTEITFDLPSRSDVALQVLDISGRLVRTLANGTLESGRYTICWDGADNNGTNAASGVYFYRLCAGDYLETRRMVLIK